MPMIADSSRSETASVPALVAGSTYIYRAGSTLSKSRSVLV
jgi:hypothetical protein